MAEDTLRVLCVHGVNTPETNTGWQADWRNAVRQGVARWQPEYKVRVDFVDYNDLFVAAGLTPIDYVQAVGKLVASGVGAAISGLFGRTRGFGQLNQAVRWTAGMVVQWVENEALREQTRKRVKAEVERRSPDVVLAHSLGSLLCYDTFIHAPGNAACAGRTVVTFGSQIGNPFVRNTFGGRLVGIERARFWYHLYNRYDSETFTAPIRLPDPNFAQVAADFNLAGILDHDAVKYLSNPGMVDTVWREILAAPARRARGKAAPAAAPMARMSTLRRPGTKRRALLVGINEYKDPADRLEGCVNDVFLMSSLLQECAFEADDIRVVLDHRATTSGILDRLGWLLEDTQEGDERVFFYSGHGAQLPAYAPNEKVDHKDECLVPHDFDWSLEHAVTDDQFFDLYSQLPYGSRFVAIFDCCHSGGISRAGGARVRGLSPPDDIRHRDMEWNPKHQMWVERGFTPVNKSIGQWDNAQGFLGESKVTSRLGRAVHLRQLEDKVYNRVRDQLGHHGPYMPLILEACGEKQLASEYRHGVTSYGAFTYCLAKTLRNPPEKKGDKKGDKKGVTFDDLIGMVGDELEELKYDQKPEIVGPQKVRALAVPWMRQVEGAKGRATKPAARRATSGRRRK